MEEEIASWAGGRHAGQPGGDSGTHHLCEFDCTRDRGPFRSVGQVFRVRLRLFACTLWSSLVVAVAFAVPEEKEVSTLGRGTIVGGRGRRAIE